MDLSALAVLYDDMTAEWSSLADSAPTILPALHASDAVTQQAAPSVECQSDLEGASCTLANRLPSKDTCEGYEKGD